MSRLAQLSGTLTVLCAVAWLRPQTIAAQGIGTMQVSAEVVRAEPAWTGLHAAQEAARSLATTTPTFSRTIELGLSRISVDAATGAPLPAMASSDSGPRPVSVVIEYLRN